MARVLILLVFFLVSCTSSSKISNTNSKTSLSNPLDNIKVEPVIPVKGQSDSLFRLLELNDEAINLSIKGKQKTEYEIIKVWRVQIGALTDLEQAKTIQNEAIQKLNSNVIIKEVKAYKKVLVGEFRIRAKADQFMYDVRNQGYQSAWVVPDEIQVVKGTYPKDVEALEIDFSLYRIQVGSYSSEINAKKVKQKIETLSGSKVLIYKKGMLFKVLAGESKTKNELLSLESILRKNGLKTWISNQYK